ncbi:MAG: sugar phosphate isomerase/epimerase [Phycisphaerae bacterium]|nr:sugar phosphate isomerase/epimerase [Phycisphaerae bacterium]
MKPAFSTVACPDWTLSKLATRAVAWGFTGCELRTFGYASREFACDPALTAPAKLRGMLDRSGLSICSLATGIRYDDPITPPLLGFLLDHESMIRETQHCIDLAVQLEAPFVRVFGFEIVGHEPRPKAVARIVERLLKCLDYCRNSGVRILLENGGSFSTAVDLAEIMDKADHQLLCASYSVPVAIASGEKPENGVNVLGERLACVKLKDMQQGRPCALGEGDVPCRAAVESLGRAGYGGWVVYEFDRAWLGASDVDVDTVMAASARTLYRWIEGHVPSPRHPVVA